MITLQCVNINGSQYARGIVAASINTVTEDDESPFTWVKFWDGSKAVSIKTPSTVEEITAKVFVAKHGKKAPVTL